MTNDDRDDTGWKVHRLSLRIAGDGVPVDDLGTMLGIEPTSIARKGELDADGVLADATAWEWTYPAHDWLPFEEQIAALLDRIEPHRASLRDFFATADVDGELCLGYGSGDGEGWAFLSHELLERIVSFGLSIALDVYPSRRV